jgi:hypothetical protein
VPLGGTGTVFPLSMMAIFFLCNRGCLDYHHPMETDIIVKIVVIASAALAVGLYLYLYR